MINILNKQECCGCFACSQICPKHCISMCEDQEGFCYPQVDKALCIDCHLCEKICPILHLGIPRKPLKVYAAKNRNEEIRMKSSSGGVFTVLAEEIIDAGGVVFGAKFDDEWSVLHGYAETKEGVADFRTSKYVQSLIGNCFEETESFLKSGRKVLFSGTPCQIWGLKSFLRKEYDNLLTVDFICHGVPSPKVWRMYLNETLRHQYEKEKGLLSSINERDITIKDISFRDKCLGWDRFSFTLTYSVAIGIDITKNRLFSEPLYKNIYLKGFLRNLYLRPSCHKCSFRELKSNSDLTLGDYWGIQNLLPEIDDNKGISLLLINTERFSFLEEILKVYSVFYGKDEKLSKIQHALMYDALQHKNRHIFFENLTNNTDIYALIKRESLYPISNEIREKLMWYLRGTVLMPLYRKLKYGKKR